jgi:hypothetical protein
MIVPVQPKPTFFLLFFQLSLPARFVSDIINHENSAFYENSVHTIGYETMPVDAKKRNLKELGYET